MMSKEYGRILGGTVAVLFVLGMGGILTDHVLPQLADPGGLTGAQQERMEKVASASLFGQFRTSMADYLWLKADKYMHRGVELRGMTEQEKQLASTDKVGSNPNDPMKIVHREETTVVPSKANDWRGHIGDIEREVTPYMDMSNHGHADGREALPLFRLMTWSNPHFVKGYIVGAAYIDVDQKHTDKAIDFLKEGETNNPQSIEIKTELAFFFTRKKQQYDLAMPYIYQVLKLVASRDVQTLNEDEKEAWQNAYRWGVLNRREANDLVTARKFAMEGLKYFPEDVVCNGFLKQYPK